MSLIGTQGIYTAKRVILAVKSDAGQYCRFIAKSVPGCTGMPDMVRVTS